ncbi:MAG: polysaccharide biosynthesis tyrosine autokinase [Anaerolineae bacterium]|nr:polysaccharide biosynthesis tyrosine autokinase [Anaerolineae bacterium]
MQILDYIKVFWRRKWIIIFTMLAAAAAAFVGTSKLQPIYVSYVTLRVYTYTTGTADFLSHDIMYAERLMQTYIEMVTSYPILDAMMETLELEDLPTIEATYTLNTEFLTIKVEAPEPEVAADAAALLAELLIKEIEVPRETVQIGVLEVPGLSSDPLQRDGKSRVEVFEPARMPESGGAPNKSMFLAMGTIIGLVGGVMLAAVIENLDTKLYSTDQIERATGLPALGAIPAARKARQVRAASEVFAYAEAFRRLRTNLFAAQPGSPVRTLVVTSAEPEEGKSTVVVNLGLSIAQTGSRVILVDADMRRPVLHTLLDLSNEVGLSNVLADETPLDEAVQASWLPGMTALTSGPLDPDAAEWLGSSKLAALLDRLAQQYDAVLLDASSLLAVTDAAVLAQRVDAVLLVVQCARTRRPAVQAAIQELAQVNVEPLGVVANRAKLPGRYRQRYYQKKGAGLRERSAPVAADATESVRDPLAEIEGIGADCEALLYTAGISTFAQLAAQTPEELAQKIGDGVTGEQISQERWIEQAQTRVQDHEAPA